MPKNQLPLFVEKDENGDLVCKEYVKDSNGNFPDRNSPTRVIKAANSLTAAQLLIRENGNGDFVASAPYEYLFQSPVATVEDI